MICSVSNTRIMALELELLAKIYFESSINFSFLEYRTTKNRTIDRYFITVSLPSCRLQ